MNDDLVSIVTPAWKAAGFVGDAIRSVQAQDHANWEMLIVDDCSPDDTAAVVERFAAADPRVKLIRQPQNQGPAMARNAALERAAGRWIAFLDSDDWWLPGKLSTQLQFMREHKAALSYTAFRRVSADGARLGSLIRIPRRVTYRALLGNTAIATSTAIVDRSITGPFSMRRTYYDDFALWLELLRRGHVGHGLAQDLMRYRVVGASVSRNKARSALMIWRTLRDVEKLGRTRAAWHFANYAVRGALKYARF